jgi:HEAT repeats
MPMSMAELRQQLSTIEPDESTYEGIGPSEVDSLRELLEDEEAWLAARAVHALSRIDSEDARQAIRSATQNPRPEIRVAVAASAGSLPVDLSDEVLSTLLGDSDTAVRKFAIRSVSERNSDPIGQRIQEMARTDTDVALRSIAEEKARSMPPS